MKKRIFPLGLMAIMMIIAVAVEWLEAPPLMLGVKLPLAVLLALGFSLRRIDRHPGEG